MDERDTREFGRGPHAARTVRRIVRVVDPDGLHARPCTRIARAAERFECRIVVLHGGREADARSILDLLGLGVLQAADIELHATGDDAAACVAALARIVAGRPPDA